MQVAVALMLLALDSAGGGEPAASLREEMLAAAARQAARPARLGAVAPVRQEAAGESPPSCLGDVCQPQVSVPGHAPGFGGRVDRTRLTLEALDWLRLEPVATMAWWVASTGVRLDYSPAAADAAANGGAGAARGRILVAWHIDAFGSPVFAERRR